MKTLFAVLLTLVAGMAFAEEIKIVDGEVMLVPSNLVATGVKVSPEAERYPIALEEVFRDRTREVAVQTKEKRHVVDFFHYRVHEVQTVGVKYEVASNTIGVTMEPKVREVLGDHFFWFPILWIMGILAMVVSNVWLWRKKPGTALFATVIVLFADTGITGSIDILGNAAVFTSIMVSLLSAVFVFNFALMYDDDSKRRHYLVFVLSVVYYASMAVLAGAIYYPLFI